MLKKIINSARIEMEIIPIDPLLVKSGQASVSGVVRAGQCKRREHGICQDMSQW